jgi:hypothetical protein
MNHSNKTKEVIEKQTDPFGETTNEINSNNLI